MTAYINHRADGCAEIVIDRDAKRNALDAATVDAITQAARELAMDDALRVVVLRSEGTRAFSAGADIGDLASQDETTAWGFIDRLRGAIQAVQDLPVPVICRIQGACIGGAMEMAAGCDLRIAAETATFCMPEVRVGIPSVIQAVLLARLMGRGRANWLMLSGEVIDAKTATDWGFVEKLIDADALDSAVDEAVASILACAPAAVRTQKRLLTSWDTLPLDDAVTASMDIFAESYRSGEPAAYMARLHKK